MGDTDIAGLATLTLRLQEAHVDPQIEDARSWDWEVFKLFSVKSSFVGFCLELVPGTFPAYDLIWKSCALMKARVFPWMAWLGKVNTIDVIQKNCLKYTLLPSRSCFCHINSESINHMLLGCPIRLQDLGKDAWGTWLNLA
ncbi:hypothetical protein Scep_017614 [Stephania cephalantha]|uniref:Reverse transcriptase zinc-binding domain-containing protein n=1 Tax=Stephania cephalantha TaxID=152367 RepID=A0AAP0IRS9_9MAGN